MAVFIPKTSEEILRDAINYLYLNTNISDFNVGSVIRTILETMAIEDANQYYQMYSILNSFFLDGASGTALDDRAAQFNVARLPATNSAGEVVFLDTNLQRSFLINDVAAGDTSLFVEDASIFGAAPFQVQLGESSAVEQVSISAIDAVTGELTINPGATTYSHSAAATGVDEVDNLKSLVCLYDVSTADRTISSGTTIRAEPTNITFEIECITTEVGLHQNGYFTSNPVAVRSNTVGSISNIPARRANQIIGGSPYAGASVVNLKAIAGGRDAEVDEEFRTRIREHIASLASGTKTAILSNLFTTTDPVTNSIVTRAHLVEDFDAELVYAYIDDSSSTGIANSEERPAEDTVSVAGAIGATTIDLNSIDGFTAATISNASYVILNPLGASPFVTQYALLNEVPAQLQGIPAAPAIPALGVGNTVSLCEAVSISTEEGRKYYQLDKFPLGDDLLRLYVVNGTELGGATLQTQLAPGACSTGTEDFIVNEATGQIEFLAGKIPIVSSGIYAIYENYINLLKEAQTVIDGNLDNIVGYPGIRSAGVKVLVRPAKRTPVDVTLDVTIDSQLTDIDTAGFLSKQLVISYVNNLGIGDDVILAEIIERIMGVDGVTNVHVITPQADVTINGDSAAYADSVLIV